MADKPKRKFKLQKLQFNTYNAPYAWTRTRYLFLSFIFIVGTLIYFYVKHTVHTNFETEVVEYPEYR